MKDKKLLLVDDNKGFVDEWQKQLGAISELDRFEIETLTSSEFKSALHVIEARRRKARSETVEFDKLDTCEIDAADILIVDFDLLEFEGDDDNFAGMPTGERVAYLARCYSQCGLIVTLNQFGNNRFDLTLKGSPWSFADINLGSEQLSNLSLWKDGYRRGFSPWSWFLLPAAADAFTIRYERLMSAEDEKPLLDRPILAELGFSGDTVGILPRSILEFLSTGKPASELTFRDFVTEGNSCLRRLDQPLNNESIARIAAARTIKWIERVVRPGQDILVDAPHLVARFPSLLESDEWDKTADTIHLATMPIKKELIAQFLFSEIWSSRPIWFWEKLKNFDQIEEIKDPFRTEPRIEFLRMAFCEDLSKFLPKEATREFVADLPSPFIRRYVVDRETEEGAKYRDEVKDVDYAPAVRFTM